MMGVDYKKILLVTRPICPPWDEASKNFAYNLALNMQPENVELHLLTNGILSDLPGNIKQEPVYDSNRWNFSQKLKSLFYQIGNRGKYDIAHYFFTPTLLTSFILRNFAKSQKTRTIQTVATIREDLFSGAAIKKSFFGDVIVTYSDYAKNKLASLGLQNIERIYPGIDTNHFSPAPKNIKLMNDWKISADDFVITYPGEYTRLGATDDIAETMMQLDEKNIKLVFACRIKNEKDLKKKDEIRKKFEKAGVLGNIIFTDTYADMEKIYNLSDAIVFPVRDMRGKFDVPLAVIEAMSCSKPVIISNIPILQEFANENNSVIIEAGNVVQLRNSILDLQKDKVRREEIGKNARQFVQINFDIQKAAEKYKNIYIGLG